MAAVRAHLGYDLRLDLAPPLEVLREGADKKVLLEWLDEVLIENGAGPLQLGYHLEPGYSLENCLVIHDELYRRDLVGKGQQ